MQPVTNLSYQTKSQVNLDVAKSDIPSHQIDQCFGQRIPILDSRQMHLWIFDRDSGHECAPSVYCGRYLWTSSGM